MSSAPPLRVAIVGAGVGGLGAAYTLSRNPAVHLTVYEARDVLDLLRGAFPGGSITGAPKLRAMQIIEELEPHRRGVYCGAIGYIGFDGAADLNIAIRTAMLRDGVVDFWAGGGLVADSDPALEYAETLAKAAGFLALAEDA